MEAENLRFSGWWRPRTDEAVRDQRPKNQDSQACSHIQAERNMSQITVRQEEFPVTC